MCGIWGSNGLQKPNADKLKILAMMNVARGDDSCGVFWDGEVYKGVESEANIFKFLEHNTLPDIKNYFTIIGHNRKSTAGRNERGNCHPFSYFTEGQDEESVPYAVGAHNGTIKNRDEILKKYKVSAHAVDSAEILNVIINSKSNQNNINVLNDYEGFGCFVWTFPEKNSMYIFRGKSDAGETETGERPMYYWKDVKNSTVYISSIKESLMIICDDEEKVIREFEANKIHIITDGKIATLKREFKRADRNKTATYTSTTSTYSPPKPTKIDAKSIFVNFPQKSIHKFNKKDPKRDTGGKALIDTEPDIDIKDLMRIRKDKTLGGKVQYSAGKYKKNGHVLGTNLKKGETIKLDANGYFQTCDKYDESTEKEYYFWNGWTCIDGAALEEICDMYGRGAVYQNGSKENFNLAKIKDFFDCVLFNPMLTGGFNILGNEGHPHVVYFTGTFKPLFNIGKSYTFKNGHFEGVTLEVGGSHPDIIALNETTNDEEEIVEETGEVGTIYEEEGDTDSERKEIEQVLITSIDEIDIAKIELEKMPVLKENEGVKERVVFYLSEAYKFLNDEWEGLSKTEEELKETIY